MLTACEKRNKPNSVDLIFDEQGRARWQDFQSGIDAIDRLRAIIKIPERLKQVLTTEGLLDRPVLERATGRLSAQLEGLEERVTALSRRFGFSHSIGKKDSYLDLSPEGFSNWLAEAASEMQSESTLWTPSSIFRRSMASPLSFDRTLTEALSHD